MMKTITTCSSAAIIETLRFLQESGQKKREGIVLWLGSRESDTIRVRAVYQPVHIAKADIFRIPPESMLQIKEYLRKNRLFIAAQVHSHPVEAFHSQADDRWAIVRHAGALSLVIPHFAMQTTLATFLSDAAVYQLSQTNDWERLPQKMVEAICQITP